MGASRTPSGSGGFASSLARPGHMTTLKPSSSFWARWVGWVESGRVTIGVGYRKMEGGLVLEIANRREAARIDNYHCWEYCQFLRVSFWWVSPLPLRSVILSEWTVKRLVNELFSFSSLFPLFSPPHTCAKCPFVRSEFSVTFGQAECPL